MLGSWKMKANLKKRYGNGVPPVTQDLKVVVQ